MQETTNIFFFLCLGFLSLNCVGTFCLLFSHISSKKLIRANAVTNKKIGNAINEVREAIEALPLSQPAGSFGPELKAESIKTQLGQNPAATDRPVSRYRQIIDEAHNGKSAKEISETAVGVSRAEAQELITLSSKIRAAEEDA